VTPSPRPFAALLVISAVVWIGCGPDAGRDLHEDVRPVAIADQEDAVCGMLVREQSAPRAQLVHRDGERAFFCSVGDLLVHLSAPSPHGSATDVFVEVLSADEDPGEAHLGEHPWRPADQVVYVVGVDRPGIMGAPVLAYADAETARRVAERHPGAEVFDLAALKRWWSTLQAAP